MNAVDLAYIAGFIDGEGCLTICQDRSYYRPFLLVFNNNREILEWIRDVFKEGKVYNRSSGPRYFALYFNINAMRKVLPQILPYLKVKKRHAELLIEHLKLRENGRSLCHTDNANYNKAIRDLHAKIHALNRRLPAEMINQVVGVEKTVKK